MSDAPARFTAHGSFISVPMEAAASIAGCAVFSHPFIAWEALRARRQANADRKYGRYSVKGRNPANIRVGFGTVADIIDPWFDTNPYTGEIVWELTETGGRGYFPSPDGFDDVNETVNAVMDSFDPWAQERNERHNASNRAHNVRAERIMAQIGFPPMSGGSPWAARDTGWHADGCLCRSCR